MVDPGTIRKRVFCSTIIVKTSNVLHKHAGHTSMTVTLLRPHQKSQPPLILVAMPLRNNVQKPLNEPQIQLALQAMKRDANLTYRRAAAIYGVPQSTLGDRLAKRQSRADWKLKTMNLLLTEKEVIV
jgi:hypothetical protein